MLGERKGRSNPGRNLLETSQFCEPISSFVREIGAQTMVVSDKQNPLFISCFMSNPKPHSRSLKMGVGELLDIIILSSHYFKEISL